MLRVHEGVLQRFGVFGPEVTLLRPPLEPEATNNQVSLQQMHDLWVAMHVIPTPLNQDQRVQFGDSGAGPR